MWYNLVMNGKLVIICIKMGPSPYGFLAVIQLYEYNGL